MYHSLLQTSEWASNMEGRGAYMTVKFNKTYKIDRIRLMQRINRLEQNKEIQLCFADRTCQLVSGFASSLYIRGWRA